MATFETLEESQEASRPIELYEFALGSEEFRYTSSEDEITVGGNVYTHESISRNSVAQGIDERNRVLEIKCPSSNAFAERWITRPPGVPGSATVIRLQRDESPFGTTQSVVFKGTVSAVQFPGDGRIATIGVASIEGAMAVPMPRVRFSAQCNAYLYDGSCGVATAGNTFTGTVSAESGSTITVTGLSAFSSDFTAGFVKPSAWTDFRKILAQSGDVLTLNLPFATSVLSASVDCFKGCDHLIDGDCQNLYGNVIEFLGFPFVPLRNPFQTGL